MFAFGMQVHVQCQHLHRVWVKIKSPEKPADLNMFFVFPFTRVAMGLPSFDPQPYGYTNCNKGIFGGHEYSQGTHAQQSFSRSAPTPKFQSWW